VENGIIGILHGEKVLLENLIVAQLLKILKSFHRTRKVYYYYPNSQPQDTIFSQINQE
jgi:hypothetical protein